MANFSINFYTKSLARKTKLDLVIPSLNLNQSLGNKDEDYYCNSKEKFPLLICLHGFGDDEKGWQNNSPFLKMCEDNGIAACFVNGENKWYLNMGPIDDYYNLIERDILDFLYGNFSFLDKKLPLGICGVSMGGYGAMYHYLKNPLKYQCCVALSPALKPDYLDESKFGSLKELFIKNKDRKLNVYLSVGQNDFIFNQSKEFDDFLEKEGLDTRYKIIPNCDHSWNTWRQELPSVIEFLEEKKFIER